MLNIVFCSVLGPRLSIGIRAGNSKDTVERLHRGDGLEETRKYK